MADIDWAALRAAAVEAASRAYAPYSSFHVGAAGLVDDGRVITACNVENASYGLTLCAECGLVSALHASGGGRLVATGLSDHYRQIFELTRLDEAIAIHDGEASAVAAALA